MTTILLTGASGVFGSQYYAHVSAAGRWVVATDIKSAHDPQHVVRANLYALSDDSNPVFVNETDPGLSWKLRASSRDNAAIAPEVKINFDKAVNRVIGGAFALPRL